MKNILQHLYHGNLNEVERSTEEFEKTEEYEKYYASIKKLTESLSPEQQKLFDEYYDWEGAYQSLLSERTYANGVKTGMCLALELVDFEP